MKYVLLVYYSPFRLTCVLISPTCLSIYSATVLVILFTSHAQIENVWTAKLVNIRLFTEHTRIGDRNRSPNRNRAGYSLLKYMHSVASTYKKAQLTQREARDSLGI